MPFVEITLSKSLTAAEKQELCDEVDKLVKLIPGKAQYNSMVVINDAFISFNDADSKESTEPSLYLQIRMMNTCPLTAKEMFTKDVSAMVETKLGIRPRRVFVKIIEEREWGSTGKYNTI